jgi:hypothetical protein
MWMRLRGTGEHAQTQQCRRKPGQTGAQPFQPAKPFQHLINPRLAHGLSMKRTAADRRGRRQ